MRQSFDLLDKMFLITQSWASVKLRARNYILALGNKNPRAWTVICLLDTVVGSWFGGKPGTPLWNGRYYKW